MQVAVGSDVLILRPAFTTRRNINASRPSRLRVIQPRSVDEQHAETSGSANSQAAAVATLPQTGKRLAIFKAQKVASVPVVELQRPIEEYMTLPASQYSVLDAKRIERIDDETFVCYVGGLHILNFHVEPVLTLSVIVGERGPTVRLLSTKLEGSKLVKQANDRFTATMTNIVEWRDTNGLEIASDTSIQVTLEVPGWFKLPTTVLEKAGCSVMQRVLATAVPKFLEQLRTDYALWAEGKERNSS